MTTDEEMRQRRRREKFEKDGLFLTYVKSFDFEDHKGFDVMCGQHFEGQVVYHSSASDLVIDGTLEPGWHWMTSGPDGVSNDDPLPDFESACKAIELHLFRELFQGISE